MGLHTWPKDEIRQQDALVAKNALAPAELTELNRVTVILLDIFEDQLDIGRLTKMGEAEALLDAQLKQLNRPVLRDGGRISRADADRHVKEQFKLFYKQRKLARQRETDAALAELRKAEKTLPKATRKKR
jgi:hypothetical protein